MKFALLALAIGVSFGIALPFDAFKEAFEGMLTFLGLIFASVVPAMALTVSTLRASRRSIREVRILRKALDKQLGFWMSFLGVTGCLAILLLISSVADWPSEPTIEMSIRGISASVTPMSIVNAAIVFLVVLTLGKAPSFATGMRDLLRLHLDQVEAESLAALRQEHQVMSGEIAAERDPDPNFGKLIQRSDQP